ILGVVTALVLAAACFGGDRFILKPVRMLAGLSRRLAAGELSVRASLPAGYGELEELGSAFDSMAGTLEQQEAQRVVAERKIKRQVETLTTLFEGSKTLVNNLDQRTLAAEITRVCVELFDSSLACLYRAHADGRLTLLSANGPEAGAKVSLPERWDTPADGNSLLAQALQSRLPVVIDSTAAIPEGDFLRGIFGEKQQSILTVYPLASQGNAGFVLILLRQDTKPLPQEEITARDSYANLAAGSLQNARLIEETETRLKNLQALSEIDRAISGSFSRELTLNVLIQKTIERLNADAASVLLLNPNTRRLEYAAGSGFTTDLPRKISLQLGESFAGRSALERRPLFIADLKAKEIDIPLTPCLEQEGFRAYQGAPLIAKGELIGVLQAFKRSPYLPDAERQNFFEILTSQAAVTLESVMLFEKMQRSSTELRLSYDATIEGWARSLELRGWENEGHNRQAADLTVRLALALGVDSEIIPQLRQGALLHDIGMLAMPESMLLKPGALTDAEWKMLREHPVWAQRVLSGTHFLSQLSEIPYCHHERWDGSGYPRGLKAESIPLGASIFAVVDVWEALNSDRPYRRAWKREEALEYMQEQAGKLFDPQVVHAFLELEAGY
ncbi:MAG: HD domain-containing phosphohydrolase, partial [Anaerolineaceae bacterium]|nr:HD domain-containing phosphohydrolase [Anaerolineaceae bacterium]